MFGNQTSASLGASTTSVSPLGNVIAVRGSQASIGLLADPNPQRPHIHRVSVGKFLGINAANSLLIGVVTDVSLRTEPVTRNQDYITVATLELFGEITKPNGAHAKFCRGVTEYPSIDDPVTSIDTDDLRLIYDVSGTAVIDVGRLQHDQQIGAYLSADDMLSKHFAILGTTGVGKSSAVALIVKRLLGARPDLRILLLDVHNEYGRCFGDKAQVLSPHNLKLPFWLLTFEEIIDIYFGARPGLEEEIDLLAEVIPIAKANYLQAAGSTGRLALKRVDTGYIRYTVDTPVPYRIADLLALLDERMGKLENRSMRMVYHRLMNRIETVSNDPRYSFMFENANVGGDTMADILTLLFRRPPDKTPITCLQLAGFPSEVVDSIVSALCRMAFDLGLWSDGSDPLLVLCEEAHRYMSADHSVGFGPTRRAIARIAKEGRKYGVFLGLVTQRPAELDPTILSQCSTFFAMRMTNDRDQLLLRSAVPDAASHLLSFLPSLGTGEAFVFGEGAALPTRLHFEPLPPDEIPKSDVAESGRPGKPCDTSVTPLADVIERWRGIQDKQRAATNANSLELRKDLPQAGSVSARLHSLPN